MLVFFICQIFAFITITFDQTKYYPVNHRIIAATYTHFIIEIKYCAYKNRGDYQSLHISLIVDNTIYYEQ